MNPNSLDELYAAAYTDPHEVIIDTIIARGKELMSGISLYLIDWNDSYKEVTVKVEDKTEKDEYGQLKILEERTVKDFKDGVWLSFDYRREVRYVISGAKGASVSKIYLDDSYYLYPPEPISKPTPTLSPTPTPTLTPTRNKGCHQHCRLNPR